jgi:Zn-dependent protease with chaperone function
LNVVEEMAIASGVPVPTVYLLEKDKSINAFAAGFTPADAVIGVTRGTMELLNRDELQGVIAHEFSHIFNGDMRLNIRLMGVLHGITVIAMIGYVILRGASGSRKGAGAAILLLGGSLVVIGFVGVFFAKLIKSAVSRQREFLADASAVRYTRNPGGIAGALKKIGGLVYGGKINSPRAEEASHFLFADGLRAKISSFQVLATHPPLTERIRRIDSGFDGRFPAVEYPGPKSVTLPPSPKPRVDSDATLSLVPEQLTDQIGTLTRTHMVFAAALISNLPTDLTAKLYEPSGARTVIFALLLSSDPQVRRSQFKILAESGDPLVTRDTLELSTLTESCPPQAHLPIIDMALPALRRLSPRQYRDFRGTVDRLIMADQKCDLFEFTLLHVLRRHLDRYYRKAPPTRVQFYSLAALTDECARLLSALAFTGHTDEAKAEAAFREGAKELEEVSLKLELKGTSECDITGLNKSFEKLARVAPKLKRQILRASTAAVSHDRRITVREGELLRAIADALDCPLPPFLTVPGFEFENEN